MLTTSKVTVAALMTADPICVKPDDTLTDVSDIFKTHNIHHIPVVKDGQLKGIISKSDYLALSNAFPLFNHEKRETYNQKLFAALLVEEVMTKHVATVRPDDTLEIVGGIFKENLFSALPVVNDEGEVLGILTTYDLLTYLFNRPALLTG